MVWKKRILLIMAGIIAVAVLIGTMSVRHSAKEIMTALENNPDEAQTLILNSNKTVLMARTAPNLNENLTDSYNYPVFFYICRLGTPEMVEACISKGVNVNRTDSQETPLLMALSGENAERYDIANLLIDNGADVKARLKSGESVQYRCVHTFNEAEETKSVEVLKRTGEIMNTLDYRTVLGEAAAYNNRKAIDFIGDINQTDKGGNTALHSAVMAFCPEGCEYLIEKGIDRDIRNREGKTALDIAKETESELYAEMSMYEEYKESIDEIIAILGG